MLENVTAFIISFPQYVPATFAPCRLQAPRQDLYGWVLRTKMAAVSNDEAGFDSLLCFMCTGMRIVRAWSAMARVMA